MLQTMQPFFMRSRFSLTTTFLLPGGDITEKNLKVKQRKSHELAENVKQLKRERYSVMSLLNSK